MKLLHRIYQCSRLSFKFKTYNSRNFEVRSRVNPAVINRVPVHFYSTLSDQDVKRRTEELTDCFMEARELMQDAVSYSTLFLELSPKCWWRLLFSLKVYLQHLANDNSICLILLSCWWTELNLREVYWGWKCGLLPHISPNFWPQRILLRLDKV